VGQDDRPGWGVVASDGEAAKPRGRHHETLDVSPGDRVHCLPTMSPPWPLDMPCSALRESIGGTEHGVAAEHLRYRTWHASILRCLAP
jgi:hypothetical protein